MSFSRLLLFFCVFSLGIGSVRAQNAANFISIPPCRLVDTRYTIAGVSFGPPSLAGKTSRDFPVPASSCNVPTSALSYSLNITLVPHGPVLYVTAWPAGQPQPNASTMNDPSGTIIANAAVVPAGVNGAISIYVDGDTDLIVDINGYFAAPSTAATDALNQQVGQLNQQVTQANQQGSQLAQQIGQQGALLGQHTAQIGQLGQQVGQIGPLGQQVTQLGQQVSPLAQQITQLNQQISPLAQQVTQLNQQVSPLAQQITQLNQQVSPLAQQISQVSQAAAAVSQHTAQIGQLNQQVTQLGQQIAQIPSGSSIGIQSTAFGTGASSNAAQNTAIGFNALAANSNGSSNTATGANALAANISGANNVGIGAGALSVNASGNGNTALGSQALTNNGITDNNTALGAQALWSHNGNCCNTAIGFQAMFADTGGQNNVAIGNGALSANLIGGSNIAIGVDAGNVVDGYSNIDIGNPGFAGESNAIRIGTAGQQQSAYMAGIVGAFVNPSTASTVYVDATGKLGTFRSSQRYKEDIQDMGTASDALLQLRPVQFRYKQAAPDGSKPLQFGLIAEEVAQVYPELVVRDQKGQIESVQYQQLPAMLLNELQKQHGIIERQAQAIQALESRLADLEKAARSK